MMEAYTGDIKQRYYGRIEEIWDLSYAVEKVPMFRVRWAKNVTAKNEPWVLASQVDHHGYTQSQIQDCRCKHHREK
jgi:hypothetical protein